jgi:hypothetical protein
MKSASRYGLKQPRKDGKRRSGQQPFRKPIERLGGAQKISQYGRWTVTAAIVSFGILYFTGFLNGVSDWLLAPLGFVLGSIWVAVYIWGENQKQAAEDARNRATPRGRQGKAPDPELQFHQFMVQLAKEQLTKLLTRARGWKK